jgi:hypothetical protein
MNGSASHSAMFALPGRSPQPSDAVHARVAAAHPLTHAEELQSVIPTQTTLLNQAHGGGCRSLHPGDILYWVACLGGACLLLICATR